MFGFPEVLIAATMAQTPAQTGQVNPYQIDVSLVLYRGEQVSARAGSGSDNKIEGYLWMDGSGCLTGAASGTSAPPSMPGMRWHYTGVVTRQSGSEVTVDASWQRVSDPAGDAQHREVTIHPGEAVTLEAIQVPASNVCGITSARLSLSMGMPVFSGGRGVGAGGGRGSFGGGGMGAGTGVARGAGGTGAGGGRGRGTAGGAVVAGPTGYGGRGKTIVGNAATVAQVTGNVNRDENSAPLFEIPGVSYDAELWLVHTGPGLTTEDTQRLAVRVSSSSNVVTFSPVSLQTPQGPATVEVAVVARVLSTTEGRQVLRVVIARSVRDAVDNMSSMGNTIKVIPSPAVGDVVSFEIPEGVIRPSRGGGGRGGAAVAGGRGSLYVSGAAASDMLGGHQFSVRLRLKSKGD